MCMLRTGEAVQGCKVADMGGGGRGRGGQMPGRTPSRPTRPPYANQTLYKRFANSVVNVEEAAGALLLRILHRLVLRTQGGTCGVWAR